MRPAPRAVVYFVRSATQTIRVAFAVLALALMAGSTSRAEDLHYFKNYFVTGDYTVDGVGLYAKGVNGWATGTITPSKVPQGADIVAAYLYWETVETTAKPSSMNGFFDFDSNNKPYPIVGEVIGSPSTSPCWSNGGTGGPGTWLRVYRADVLRYLKVDANGNVRDVDYTHTVTLPDSGINQPGVVPHTEGASLVVVYRVLDGNTPYKAVVMYDGAYTMAKNSAAFAQTLGGFYQATGGVAKMTHIVGNGQPGFVERLTVNGVAPSGMSATPFVGAQGPRWDNLTFNITLPANVPSVDTAVTGQTNQVCLSWGAVLMSTNVVNTDGDGILDSWKTNGLHLNIGSPATSTKASVPATFGGCTDYPKDPCENLKNMGAVLGSTQQPPGIHKDIFVQLDWMQGYDGHIHSPKLAALNAIAAAFKAHGVNVHFDVGNRYQQLATVANNFVIVPQAYAQGGHLIQESSLECPNNVITNVQNCEYDTKDLGYSVLGWKTGIGAIENGFSMLNISTNFVEDRKDVFHYMLLAHALAGPVNANTGLPVTPPPSVSGVGDLFGGDVMVTLGLWRTDNPPNCVNDDPLGSAADSTLCTDQTGTSLVQAGTLFHELGHNLGLHHGGAVDTPNCMVVYPSTMNYLYQTRGLTGPAGDVSGVANGIEHIDFSSGALLGLNENNLPGILSIGTLPYRLRYYGPATGAEIASGGNAKANCNGTFPYTGTASVRLETPGTLASGTAIDWSNGTGIGLLSPGLYSDDIDFDGTIGDSAAGTPGFVDHNDWGTLNLQQVGGRPNVSGLSVDVGPADISTADLLGQSVLGQNVLGQNVLGQNVLGQSVLGQNVLGQSVLGQNVLGQSVLGQNVLGQNVLGQNVLGEVDFDNAISSLDATGASTPLVAAPSASSGTVYNQVSLTWGPPSLGRIRTYTIYRANLQANPVITVVAGSVSGAPPLTAFNDPVTDGTLSDIGAGCPSGKVCYDTNYQYYIVATDAGGNSSTPSNLVTVNVNHLYVTGFTGSVIYGNALPNSMAATISGLPVGGITAAQITCPNPAPRNVGSYADTCTGPAVGTPDTVGVTYIDGVLMITQRPLYIDAAGNTKLYDKTLTASAVPTVENFSLNVSGLVYTDTVTGRVEAYQSSNALGAGGSILAVTAYTVNDGNSGNNYSVTTKTAAGTITARPLYIDAVTNTKLYDSTTAASAMPVIEIPNGVSGLVSTDSVTGLSEAYLSANVAGANASTIVVAAYTVNDGNAGGNYGVTLKNAQGTITQRPLTIDAQPNAKTYDGTTSAATTPTIEAPTSTSGLVGSDGVTNLTETYASPNISNSDTLSVSPNYSVNDHNSGGNYSVTLNTAIGVITPAPLIAIVTGTSPNFLANSFSGFQNTDTSALIAGTPACVASPNADAAGDYPLACAGLTAPNYTISYSYAVTPASPTNPEPLTITVSGTQPYGGTPTYTATYFGLANGDTLATAVTGTLSCTSDATPTSPVGTTPAITNCSGVTAPSYAIVWSLGTVTITPAALTVVVAGAPGSNTVGSYVGFVNGDTSSVVTGTLSCTKDPSKDAANNYPISCSGLSTTQTYYSISYSYAPASVSVSPAPLTVAVNGTIKGNTPTFSVTYSGFINGDLPLDVAGTLTCTWTVSPNILTPDTITGCSGLSAPSQYAISYWLGKLKIVP